MLSKNLIAPLLAASAMALTVTPAQAGKADRARQAIAAADAKIHTAESMGASTEMPREAAQARAMLATARESLARGDKSESIDEAIHASALADTAIGVMQRSKDEQLAAVQQSRNDDVAVAQQHALNAQQEASQANARASVAEQNAANSAAEARVARMAAESPAQVETTVTTQQPAARSTRHHTARRTTTTTRRVTAAPSTTTTTTVRQAVN